MEFIKYDVVEFVGIVTFNRPPINALNLQVYDELKKTFQKIDDDKTICAVVLKSEGKVFMAGNDANDISKLTNEMHLKYAKQIQEALHSLYNCRAPVVAALNGSAVGIGVAIAACCDVILATEEAHFSIPKIDIKLIGSTDLLHKLFSREIIHDLCLTGDVISAVDIDIEFDGSIFNIVSEEQLMFEAMGVAEKISKQRSTIMNIEKGT